MPNQIKKLLLIALQAPIPLHLFPIFVYLHWVWFLKRQGEFGLIHHLSFPQGSSLNDGISSEFTSVSYATVEDAIHIIRTVGHGCFMAKTDIKNAFRIIPIQPQDYNLLGICGRGVYYYDRCMPMGCSSSCKTFEIFSSAIEWIAQKKLHIDHILHLLDDFLSLSPSYKGHRF